MARKQVEQVTCDLCGKVHSSSYREFIQITFRDEPKDICLQCAEKMRDKLVELGISRGP